MRKGHREPNRPCLICGYVAWEWEEHPKLFPFPNWECKVCFPAGCPDEEVSSWMHRFAEKATVGGLDNDVEAFNRLLDDIRIDL